MELMASLSRHRVYSVEYGRAFDSVEEMAVDCMDEGFISLTWGASSPRP